MKNLKQLLYLSLVVLLGGCAAQTNNFNDLAEPADPWESFNRPVFAFNEGLDKAVVKPVSSVYSDVLPSFVRARITSFFANIEDIPIAANNFMQGNVRAGFGDLARVVVNSTVGIAGLFDVASKVDGLEKHDEDFGQTLAVWGVGSGPYLVVPILGPSTARDFPSRIVDFFMNPISYLDDASLANQLRATKAVDTRANFIPLEGVVRNLSPDYYIALRNFYLKRRQNLIENNQRDGDAPEIYQELISKLE